MELNFSENIIIEVRESGGDNEYSYSYFKEGFEEWAEMYDLTMAEISDLKQYLNECGYNVIEIEERRN